MTGHLDTELRLDSIRPPRALHVAALPFPTYQGTQAAIHAMLDATSRVDPDAALFTYATEGYATSTRFAVHRVGDLPRLRSLRSGPSLGKLVVDARMLFELQALARKLRRDGSQHAGIGEEPEAGRRRFRAENPAELDRDSLAGEMANERRRRTDRIERRGLDREAERGREADRSRVSEVQHVGRGGHSVRGRDMFQPG